jgi:hypothetical protein
MSTDADKVWDLVANKLRKKKGLCPPTPEEAAEAFKNTKAIPLTDEEMAAIVEKMVSEESPIQTTEPSTLQNRKPLNQEINAECAAMFRNEGEGDEETERLEAELEQELLNDETEGDDGHD